MHKWSKRIPFRMRGIMEYYPDVILFELNPTQYKYLWQRLSTSEYIYTDGYQIRPTNWGMHAFQSFKGWLGLDNHCQSEKISFTLNKLAYYGYTKGYAQPPFPVGKFPISEAIFVLAKNTYTNQTTALLQNELIREYFKFEPHLNLYPSQELKSNHRFGEGCLPAGVECIPHLDPQDESLISWVIRAIDRKGIKCKDIQFVLHSKYAQAAAQFYCQKASDTQVPSLMSFARLFWQDPRPGYLAQAVSYHPDIAKLEAEKYVEHHIQKKEYKQAFNLIGLLSDSKLILKFLQTIPCEECNQFITKDSKIAAILAKDYLQKNQFARAKQLYTDLESLDADAVFRMAVQEKKFDYALDVFNRLNDSISFNDAAQNVLSQHFYDAGSLEYTKGQVARDNKEWDLATSQYLKSLEYKKSAHALNPISTTLNDLHNYKRHYAQLLIEVDCELYDAEKSDIAAIQKALSLLRECKCANAREVLLHQHALSNGLMRRIDTLREKISFRYYDNSDFGLIKEHSSQHDFEIRTLMKTLEEVITLLQGTRDPQLRLKLGKAHYLLADVQDFFSINSSDINQHYKAAMAAVPENPFYILRVKEVFPHESEDLNTKGVINLKNLGYEVIDLYHFSEERWAKRPEIIYPIKDIHTAPTSTTLPPESTWNYLFGYSL